jgi:ribosomal protein L35AE/L33A
MAVQGTKFTKHKGDGSVWIVPEHIIYMEPFEKKEGDKLVKGTIVHVSGKEGKVFVKEHPDEINKILRTLDREGLIDDLRRVIKKHA